MRHRGGSPAEHVKYQNSLLLTEPGEKRALHKATRKGVLSETCTLSRQVGPRETERDLWPQACTGVLGMTEVSFPKRVLIAGFGAGRREFRGVTLCLSGGHCGTCAGSIHSVGQWGESRRWSPGCGHRRQRSPSTTRGAGRR